MQTRLTLLRIVALALLVYSLALFVTSVREAAQAENSAQGRKSSRSRQSWRARRPTREWNALRASGSGS